jgi:uncharacterized protein (TIGR03083 family)
MPVRLPAGEDARTGAAAQYALLAEHVAGLPDKAFAEPTRLDAWSTAELVAHVARTAEAISRYAAQAGSGAADMDVLTYLASMRSVADAVAQRGRDAAEGRKPKELRAEFATMTSDAIAALETVPLDAVVPARLGSLPFGDFLVTRCVEGVVHGLDLGLRTPDPTALKVAIRILAAVLERAAPGKAVELRVPGHVAVQLLSGPRHTRGTPGNVVEADPLAFVEVASGRQRWDDAVARGMIRGSGNRADLSEYLPVIG